MLELLFYLPVLLLLIGLSAFFSGSEMAYNSASGLRMDELARNGDRRALSFCRFLHHPELFLGTVLVGNNLVNISLVTIAQMLLAGWLEAAGPVRAWLPAAAADELLTSVLVTPVVLVFGEILPKAVGRNNAESFSLLMARPMYWGGMVLRPLIVAINWIAQGLTRPFSGANAGGHRSLVTREDLMVIAEMLAEQGLVNHDAGDMLQSVLEMDQKPVETVMVPLVEMRSLAQTATVAELEQLTAETGFTRFPVYSGRIDEIVGVISLREVLARTSYDEQDEPDFLHQQIAPFVNRAVTFVPESKPVSDLLPELRGREVPMAMVIDEYGGVIGLVTIEDLAAQIVGTLSGRASLGIRCVENGFECDGKLDVRDLEEELGCTIENVGFETAAGLVLKELGRIPEVGETFRYASFEVTVLSLRHRRIERLSFIRLP